MDHVLIARTASRQAARDCSWDEDDPEPFPLDRKQLKREATFKAAFYARAARRQYAISYERAYRRYQANRVRYAS